MSGGCTVLVVDDDADLRAVVAEVLDDAGYRPLTAEHGRAALDLLERLSGLPDLILLDVMMPVMDGPVFAAALHNDPRLAGIPLLVFSAHADHERVASSIHAAASLRKPLELCDLLAAVERVLRSAPGATPDRSRRQVDGRGQR